MPLVLSVKSTRFSGLRRERVRNGGQHSEAGCEPPGRCLGTPGGRGGRRGECSHSGFPDSSEVCVWGRGGKDQLLSCGEGITPAELRLQDA